MVGKRFGSLIVEKFDSIKSQNIMFYCKCDCGGNITTRGSSLRNGVVISCGCVGKLNRSVASKNRWKKLRKSDIDPCINKIIAETIL
jgi:hypothetical protein